MRIVPTDLAALTQPTPQELVLSGSWTACCLGPLLRTLSAVRTPADTAVIADASHVEALDTAGAWVLQEFLTQTRSRGAAVTLHGMRPDLARLMDVVATQVASQATKTVPGVGALPNVLERTGRSAKAGADQALALLAFVGESAIALAGCVTHPTRFRWRTILFNIRTAGFDALPIVGLLSFLLGVVIAYQGADQLRQYGGNIFIADLVGIAMLREFAPLIAAIIVAGRSGSAYAAQIGTMVVTEEIDAMRTLDIAPLDLLVLPKIIALAIALPLLTVFADVMGVIGGMIMARVELAVTYGEFLDRFVKAVVTSTYMVGISKAPVFAAIIVVIGCFQGFRTSGGADSVGRQTTLSVVQSIFLVVVVDALFSVAFSALDL
jgi:phospholipid/cholesterol/gamma-HCH transport system permease protein